MKMIVQLSCFILFVWGLFLGLVFGLLWAVEVLKKLLNL